MLAQDQNLGKWIRGKFETNREFASKIGAHPTMVSRWLGGAGISAEYQKAIRKLGYQGPFPEEEGGPAGSYVTEETFEAWRKFWYEGQERVLKNYEDRLKDLAQRIEQLEKRVS